MARSLATAIVTPNGSNDACDTHDATIAERALLWAAVTTYKPDDSRPSAFWCLCFWGDWFWF
jgi:hypothetical protein